MKWYRWVLTYWRHKRRKNFRHKHWTLCDVICKYLLRILKVINFWTFRKFSNVFSSWFCKSRQIYLCRISYVCVFEISKYLLKLVYVIFCTSNLNSYQLSFDKSDYKAFKQYVDTFSVNQQNPRTSSSKQRAKQSLFFSEKFVFFDGLSITSKKQKSYF